MSDDREWDEWSRLWRGPEGDAPVPEADVAAARREVRRQFRDAAYEVSASVFLLAVAGWLVVRRAQGPVLAIAMALCVYAGVWLAWFFAVRQGSWRVVTASVAEHLALGRRRRLAAVRWARFARWCTAAWVALLAAWGPWMFLAHRAKYAAEPWRAMVGFGGAAAILAACWWWYGRKLARARQELEAFEALARAASGE